MAIEYPDIIIPTCGKAADVSPIMSDLQGFSQGCRVFATCRKVSAAMNRNIGLEWARAPYIIMLDDDIGGFFSGWWKMMVKPLEEHTDIVMVSARLLNPDRTEGPMMFAGDKNADLAEVPRVPTACVAFRNDGLRFDDGTLVDSLDDEGYIGSGFEDDDFCARVAEKYPGGRVVINNAIKLVHFNEMKNQAGKYFIRNKAYFDRQWIDRGTTRERRSAPEATVDYYGNIPKILRFVWIGTEMPEWAKANIAEFKRLNPDFEIKIHGEESLDSIFKELYARINHPEHTLAIKSDLIRLSVLQNEGGWYFDCDFWPLVSIADMCAAIPGMRKRMVIFANGDRTIVANGAIGCRKDDPGLRRIIQKLLTLKLAHPEWWDYGTMVFYQAYHEAPGLFCVQDLKKIIPFTGKDPALAAMKSKDEIEKSRAGGSWAIHFEMTGKLYTGEICTIKKAV